MSGLPVWTETAALTERPAAAALTAAPPNAVGCLACAHRCLIPPGRAGKCGFRHNRDGQLFAPWGYVAAASSEPLEKKPFFHVLPGRKALTFGMLGCNLHCDYCMNWPISQARRDPAAGSAPLPCSAADLVRLAIEADAAAVVASYNEPIVAVEWAVEVFQHARDAGLRCGVVTNGLATREALALLRPCVEMLKIDLKAFDAAGYRRFGGDLLDVLASIERARAMGFWLEVVTIVVPGFNDDERQLRGLAAFLAAVSPQIPWHVAPFLPDYRMRGAEGHDRATSRESLLRAYDIGLAAGLQYVYVSAMPGTVGAREHTHCPNCRTAIIERTGWRVQGVHFAEPGRCRCGWTIPGLWGES